MDFLNITVPPDPFLQMDWNRENMCFMRLDLNANVPEVVRLISKQIQDSHHYGQGNGFEALQTKQIFHYV